MNDDRHDQLHCGLCGGDRKCPTLYLARVWTQERGDDGLPETDADTDAFCAACLVADGPTVADGFDFGVVEGEFGLRIDVLARVA